MNKRSWSKLLLLALLLVTSALSAREPSPPYEMEIRRTSSGIALKCNHGCDWISLSGSCDAGRNCYFLVNEKGIRSVPEP